MTCYKKEKKNKTCFGDCQCKRRIGKALPLANRRLTLKIRKRIERVRGIELFVIFSVATLYLPIVSGSKRPDSFMLNRKLFQSFLKQGLFGSSG